MLVSLLIVLHFANYLMKFIKVRKRDDQIIDNVSQDKVLEAGFNASARDKAMGMVEIGIFF